MKATKLTLRGKKSSAEKRDEFSMSKLSMSLDYIFGKCTAHSLKAADLEFKYSRRTGRLKYVIAKENKEVLFSLRPNGSIAPSLAGYSILLSSTKLTAVRKRPAWTLTVIDGVSEIVSRRRTVFCKHVNHCSDDLRSGQDVAVLNERGDLLAAGRATIPGPMIKRFKRGVAVKVREGREKKNACDEFRQPADPSNA